MNLSYARANEGVYTKPMVSNLSPPNAGVFPNHVYSTRVISAITVQDLNLLHR